jgi:hypothetical protein
MRGECRRLLVSGRPAELATSGGWNRFKLPALLDHEVVVTE